MDISECISAGPSWCDVVILVQGEKFHSCKGTLAADAPQREIRLEGFTETGFKPVWDYIHGTRLEVEGEEGALAALRDAHFLGIKRLCDKMSKIVKALLGTDNAFRILSVADHCERKDLREAAIGVISVRFSQVIQTREFLSISFETLASFLARDELEISSEEEVYEATRRWLDVEESRRRHLPDLLEKIRLPVLPNAYLKTVVLKDPVVRRDSKCLDIALDAIDNHIPELRGSVPKEKTRPRGTLQKSFGTPRFPNGPPVEEISNDGEVPKAPKIPEVEKIEIYCLGERNKERKIYRIDTRDWDMSEVADYPHDEDGQFYRSFAAIERKLFVTGCGETKTFHVERSEWEDGPEPPEFVSWSGSAVDGGSLFVCGGRDVDGKNQRWVTSLDVESGKWVWLSDMRWARNGAGACWHDGCLYVIGGFTSGSRKCERLDLRTSRWEELAELPREGGNPALAFRAGELVVAGGDGGEGTEVYGYDGRKNEWREMKGMMERRHRHGLVSLDGKLCAVGGFGNSSVEVFDGGKWEIVKKYGLRELKVCCKPHKNINSLKLDLLKEWNELSIDQL
ncbi:unnamed protein product, partial [Darwinula stevensoni]